MGVGAGWGELRSAGTEACATGAETGPAKASAAKPTAAKARASGRDVTRIFPVGSFESVGQASLPALQVVAEVGKACADAGTEACATGTEACATKACVTTRGARQTGSRSFSRAAPATEGCGRTAVAARPAVVGASPIPRPGGW
jgi:hypothetical protein